MPMLRLFLSNLAEHPNVPRYRRISTSNTNFKKRVLPLEGHKALLEATGFQAKGSAWEWRWHEEGDSAVKDNKTVLAEVISRIDAASKRGAAPPAPGPSSEAMNATGARSKALPTTGSPPSPHAVGCKAAPSGTSSGSMTALATTTSTLIAATPLGAGALGSDPKDSGPRVEDAEPARSTAVPEGGGGAGGGSAGPPHVGAGGEGSQQWDLPRVDYFNTGKEGKEQAHEPGEEMSHGMAASGMEDGGGESGGEVGMPRWSRRAPCGGVMRNGGIVGSHEGVGGGGGETGKQGSTTESSLDQGGNGARPPSTMAEVVESIQRGETPPGICRVEDRLSTDASGLMMTTATATSSSPPKPWEVAGAGAGAGAGGNNDRKTPGDGDDPPSSNSGGSCDKDSSSSSGGNRSHGEHGVSLLPGVLGAGGGRVQHAVTPVGS
ncbi:unnamed protein product [Discosporangium mesarthrocarpum]